MQHVHPMIAEPVRRYLEENHIPYRVLPHEPRYTAQEVAEAAHVSGRRLAKSVVLRLLGSPEPRFIIAALPASERVNVLELAALLRCPLALATEEEIAERFPGIELGATPPLGRLAGIPTLADICLAESPVIAFHGGSLTDLVEVSWEDFVRLASPWILDYGNVIEEEPDGREELDA
jgi:Ala-tRNA(Pro) deacylase